LDLNSPSRKFDDGQGLSGIAVAVMPRYATQALDPYQRA